MSDVDKLSSRLCDRSSSPSRQTLLKVEQSLLIVLNIHLEMLRFGVCYDKASSFTLDTVGMRRYEFLGSTVYTRWMNARNSFMYICRNCSVDGVVTFPSSAINPGVN